MKLEKAQLTYDNFVACRMELTGVKERSEEHHSGIAVHRFQHIDIIKTPCC